MKSPILAGLTLAASLFAISAPAYAGNVENPWQVRVRAIVVSPDESATISPIGGDTEISTSVVPELDISYFFTNNISAELILGVTPHDVKAIGTSLGDVDLGDVTLLPPTLTLQYHLMPGEAFNPYVGAGVNYTLFFSEDLPSGSALVDIDYDSSLGFALQAGADIKLNPDSDWFINFDVKKVWINSDVTVDAGTLGTVSADVDINPWIFGAGIGKRF